MNRVNPGNDCVMMTAAQTSFRVILLLSVCPAAAAADADAAGDDATKAVGDSLRERSFRGGHNGARVGANNARELDENASI